MPVSSISKNVDSFAYIAMLYDFYGALLTKKQGEIIEMYFMNDLSLSEISAELGITRQAAGILINRTKRILCGYESKLGLVEKHREVRGKTELIISELAAISSSANVDACVKEKIDGIINLL